MCYKLGEIMEENEVRQPSRGKGSSLLQEFADSNVTTNINEAVSPARRNLTLIDILQDRSSLVKTGIDLSDHRINSTNGYYLAVFVSARTFPRMKSSEVALQTNTGGMAIYVPQFRGAEMQRISNIINSYLGLHVVSTVENDSNSSRTGLITLDYRYALSSQNRCYLYICFEVLRIVAHLLSLEATKNIDLSNGNITIDVFTDSIYAWELLSNSSALLQWWYYGKRDEFDNSPDTPNTNTDIFFPLARIYSALRKQAIFFSFTKENGKRFAKDICIRFRHRSELLWSIDDHNVEYLKDYAQAAAELQHAENKNLSRKELVWRNRARQDIFYF